MICGDNVNDVAIDGIYQCLLIGKGLDGRVTLYLAAEAGVVTVVERKMVYTDFGGNVGTLELCQLLGRLKQIEFVGGG